MTRSRFAFSALIAFLMGCGAIHPSPAAGTAVASTSTVLPLDDAETALSAARPSLDACRRNTRGSTPVTFDARLEFEPTGKVSRIQIEPSGPVADCVRSDLSQVEIRRFEGPPLEVRMHVTL